MPFDHDAQQQAVERLQHRIWEIVAARYRERHARGLTQKQLARRLGISAPQITVWLNDPTAMTLKAAARLMLAMDAEIGFLARDADTATQQAVGPAG